MKNNLKEYYGAKELSQQQIENLLKLEKKNPFQFKPWLISPFSGAVAACLVIFTVLHFSNITLDEKVAKEVRYNHLKGMPSEVLTSQYNVINEALDRLHFKVIPSQELGEKFVLVGARYCSIQGETAAQLKMQNKENGKFFTLYQFKISEKTEALTNPFQIADEKVSVKVWLEGEIGFALAETL